MQDETERSVQSQERPHFVTVIGLGAMGSAIARRLLDTGIPVGVWNRTRQRTLALAERGATAFDDPRDAVQAATVVLTLLPTAEAVRQLMIEQGVIDEMSPGAVWAQMGTIGVEGTEGLNAEVQVRRPDLAFVDAPVSGSRQPAESGQLLVLSSGPDEAEEALKPVFDSIGRRTLWLGAAGMGSRMKLVLNTWLAFEVEAAAEAAALARRLNIAPEALQEATAGNPLASPLAIAKLAKMLSNDDRADFALEWALKDLDLTVETTGRRYAPVALAIAERWRALIGQGFGQLDVSAARHGLGDLSPGGFQAQMEPR